MQIGAYCRDAVLTSLTHPPCDSDAQRKVASLLRIATNMRY